MLRICLYLHNNRSVTHYGDMSSIQLRLKRCAHAVCPVSVGIIKAKEAEAKPALPADASIELTGS
jgi:hypothetical protein